MRKIMLILVICFAFSAISSVARAEGNPAMKSLSGFAAIFTSFGQLYKVPKANVDKYGWSVLPFAVVKAFAKMGTEIGSGGVDALVPFGNQLSEGCAFSK